MNSLRNHLRAVGRLGALIAVLVGFGLSYAVNRRHRRDATSRARWLQRACRQALRALAIEVEVRGQPVGGVLVAANHLSYLDILVLAAQTPVVFVAKREVRSWAVFGWYAERAGTRFLDRSRSADLRRIVEEMSQVLAAELSLVVFLEGTTSGGAGVFPFKSSLLEPAVRQGWRVMPAALDYAVPAGHCLATEVCWWGEMRLVPHLWHLMTLPWVVARVGWGEPFPAGGERKALAEVLHAKVVGLRRTDAAQASSPSFQAEPAAGWRG